MAYIGNTATTQAFTPAVDYFNGDGSTVAFTLSKPVASVAQVQAVIENVPQNPGSAYTVSGNTITFTSAPPSGTANIYVYYTSPITQVIAPSQGTVSSSSLQDGSVTSAKLATLTTLPAPSSNTLTLPAETGTVLTSASDIQSQAFGNVPLFRVYRSGSFSIPSNTYTKVQFNATRYDPDSYWDGTNYRYTPQVAGYYLFHGNIFWNIGPTTLAEPLVQLVRNGALVTTNFSWTASGNGYYQPQVTTIVYMNGSTDYVELYAYQNSGSAYSLQGNEYATWFEGHLVRTE